MSTANLNVWITGFGDPCHIEDKETWFVHVLDCEGRVVEWCNKRYSFISRKMRARADRNPAGLLCGIRRPQRAGTRRSALRQSSYPCPGSQS